MKHHRFEILKFFGHWLGISFIAFGVALTFLKDNAFYFLSGFVIYWLLNYLLIRGLVEKWLKPDEEPINT